jgi:putative alpha-1,2-mannosidase
LPLLALGPALPVIADAVVKGFQGFDRVQALQAMVTTSTQPRPNAPAWAQRDWSAYEQYGYMPLDRVSNESVSQNLEYGVGDDAVARVARALGQAHLATRWCSASRTTSTATGRTASPATTTAGR